MAPVDDALGRLHSAAKARAASFKRLDEIDEYAATVREALERQREELAKRPTLEEAIANVNHWKDRAERLREERDEAWGDLDVVTAEVRQLKESIKTIVKEDGVVVSRQARELRRLTKGLREISAEASKGIRAENRLPFLTHIGVIAERTLAGDPERHVRALLSASPSDGGGA